MKNNTGRLFRKGQPFLFSVASQLERYIISVFTPLSDPTVCNLLPDIISTTCILYAAALQNPYPSSNSKRLPFSSATHFTYLFYKK